MASLIDAWGQKARNAVRHHIVDTIDFLTRWKPQGPVPFAFLDAGKAGMQQKDEWLTIAPWVPVGGVIAVHDANDCDWINSQASLEAEGKMAPWEELTYPVQPHNFQRPVRPYDVGWRTRAWRRTR